MSVWSWLRLTAALWLLRKGVKAFGWLIVALVAVTAWPLTAVAVIGYLAAWLRGWPPARLWRAARLGAAHDRRLRHRPGDTPARLAGRRAGPGAGLWGRVAAAGRRGHPARRTARRPVAVPAGLGIGGLLWAWRIYAITTGLAGITASAPIEFDTRQWRRQAYLPYAELPWLLPRTGRDGELRALPGF